jgi:hypothetical protein
MHIHVGCIPFALGDYLHIMLGVDCELWCACFVREGHHVKQQCSWCCFPYVQLRTSEWPEALHMCVHA